MVEELQGRVAVVTGASRGIGAATARELARRGVSVVLSARSEAEIGQVASDMGSEEQRNGKPM